MNLLTSTQPLGMDFGMKHFGELRSRSRRTTRRSRSQAASPKSRKSFTFKKMRSPKVRRPSKRRWSFVSKSAVAKKKPKRRRALKKRKVYFRKYALARSPIRSRPYRRTIRRNRHYARVLGWKKHRGKILQQLGLSIANPIDVRFVFAVRRWQKRHALRPSGIIGPISWRRMRRLLKIQRRPILAKAAGPFFKDDPELRTIALAPVHALPMKAGIAGRLITIYNGIGNLIQELSERSNVEPAAVLAVWLVASRGKKHFKGKTPVTFENHLFYKVWGNHNEQRYRRHFRHGGHAGLPGHGWQRQQFREKVSGTFNPLRDNLNLNYRAFRLAKKLAGERKTASALRLGEPQIPLNHFASLGYPSPKKMYRAFQRSLRLQVLAFFDYLLHHPASEKGDLLIYLRKRHWQKFAHHYHSGGDIVAMTKRLRRVYKEARSIAFRDPEIMNEYLASF